MAETAAPAIKKTSIGRHYIPTALIGGAYVLVALILDKPVLLGTADAGTRSAFYISLATTCAALLGFAITAVTILLALGGGRRVAWLYKTEEFKYVRTIFLGAVNALAVGTLYFSALVVVDTAKCGHWYWEAGMSALAALVVLRVARIIRLLSDLLDIAIADRTDERVSNPPFDKPVDEVDDADNGGR